VSKSQRTKGRRGENELARLLPGARRISEAGLPGPDVLWRDRDVEVKRRKNAFQDYGWLANAQIVCKRSDRMPWLMVATIDTVLDMMEEEYDRGYREGRRRANP